MSRTRTLGLVVPALLASACSLPSASVTPRLLFGSLDGDLAASDSGASASTGTDELGLGGRDEAFSPRADLGWSGAHLSLSVLASSFEGSGTTAGEITIGGTTIAADRDVESALDLSAYSGVVTWDLAPPKLVEAGLGFGVTVVDFDFALRDTGTGERVSSDELLPVPLIAARVGVHPGRFGLTAALGYLELSYDDTDARVIDLDLAGEMRLFGGDHRLSGRLVVGYRLFDVEADYEDDGSEVHADVAIDGPYVGLSFAF